MSLSRFLKQYLSNTVKTIRHNQPVAFIGIDFVSFPLAGVDHSGAHQLRFRG
jgi:hypothetical protein